MRAEYIIFSLSLRSYKFFAIYAFIIGTLILYINSELIFSHLRTHWRKMLKFQLEKSLLTLS